MSRYILNDALTVDLESLVRRSHSLMTDLAVFHADLPPGDVRFRVERALEQAKVSYLHVKHALTRQQQRTERAA